ncbi:NAD(P)-binding protein [Clavulina sp. PMI_390]|nr:NAD(P)-binding protein [Clavulina sp. PMI_390]
MAETSEKKIIAVLTATGTQGASVVRELLKDGKFAVRGLTRNPQSEKSKDLTQQGVEMVKADAGDIESLAAAFENVYGVYANTVWGILAAEGFDQKKTEVIEVQHGKNLVDAAKKAGVQHFVWSTLDGISDPYVYHFMTKHQINSFVAQSGIPNWTLLYTSCYYSNLCMPGIEFLKKDKDGHFFLDIPMPPDTPVDWFDATEVGKWVVPIFADPAKYNEQRVDAVSELFSPREKAKIIEKVTGVPVAVKEITTEEFFEPSFRASVFDEMWLNSACWVTGQFKRDHKQSKSIVPSPVTFEEFLKTDKLSRQFLGLDV